MKEATDRQIMELNNERTRAMNEQREALTRQHGAEVTNLRNIQANLEAERNRKIQEHSQMQANLQQQIAQAQQQITELRNRPRKNYTLYDFIKSIKS